MNRLECPSCGHRLKYADEHAGKKAKCQKCGHSFRLPPLTLDQEGVPDEPTHPAQGIRARTPSSAPSPESADPPRLGRARRKWPWFAAGGLLAFLLAGGAIWFLISGDGDKPYVGLPPPVEFEIKGYKVVSSVPFHGRLEIRDSRIIPPSAPEGYEFTSEHKEIILGRSHSFGWKPKSGALLLVVCKVTVKDPAPRLERIRLMQGKQEVALIDGLAQPEFDKTMAKDLNNGLAECHKSGKTPEVGLVFRVADGGTMNSAKLAVEMEWLSQEGKLLTGRYSLRNVSLVQDEKKPEQPQPTTYEGEWRGPPSNEIHVEAVIIEKNVFPCKGTVKFAGKGVGIGTPVTWEQKEGELVGTKDAQLVARVKLADGMLSGAITVPESVRFFLGGAKGFSIAGFKKQ